MGIITTIISIVGSTLVGGVVAGVTIVSLVSSQTAEPDKSPVSVDAPASDLIQYGSN